MKKITIILFVLILPLGLLAQTKGEKLYNKYASKPNITNFSFEGSFLKNMDFNIDDDNDIEQKIKGDCTCIKALSAGKDVDVTVRKQLKADAMAKLAHGNGYKQVLKDKNNNETLFYAKGKGRKFTEFHLLHFNNNRTSIVSFYGNFTVKQIENLAKSKINNN